MAEGVPPGKDDRRLQYKVYTERDGVSHKRRVSVCENQYKPWAFGRRESYLRSIQELERSVSFMYKVWNRMIVITSPVCLNK